MYINNGFVAGTLARDPYKAAEGVVLLTVRVRDDRINPITKRREFHYPTFVVFGRQGDRALESLVKGQEVSIEYKLETRRKEKEGGGYDHFDDKVATRIRYGRKPVVAKAVEVDEDAVAEEEKVENSETKPEDGNTETAIEDN